MGASLPNAKCVLQITEMPFAEHNNMVKTIPSD
jgi:hypothetical protein